MDNGDWAALTGVVAAVISAVSMWLRMWFNDRRDQRAHELEVLKLKKSEGGA